MEPKNICKFYYCLRTKQFLIFNWKCSQLTKTCFLCSPMTKIQEDDNNFSKSLTAVIKKQKGQEGQQWIQGIFFETWRENSRIGGGDGGYWIYFSIIVAFPQKLFLYVELMLKKSFEGITFWFKQKAIKALEMVYVKPY